MNAQTWQTAIEVSYPRVLRALIGVAGSRPNAEDALHDAIVAALRPGVMEQIRRPDAWLFAVGVRALRSSAWRRTIEAALDRVRLPTASDDRVVDRVALQELLSGLTRRQREVVVARYYVDMSYAEIAAALGIREGTVSATINQSLARLRKNVEGEETTWLMQS